MKSFSIKSTLKWAWETFAKRPFFFVGVGIISLVIQLALGSFETALTGPVDPVRPLELMFTPMGLLASIVSFVVTILFTMGLWNLTLKAQADVMSPKFKDLWYPKYFWSFLGTNILTGIIIFVGLILVIVPGIIAMLALGFATLIVLTKHMKPIEALKESYRITKGKWLQLLLFYIVLVVINFIGAIPMGLGLLITIPISLLAMAHVYKALDGAPHTEPKEATAPTVAN
jgi:uncharacterized membrane protein